VSHLETRLAAIVARYLRTNEAAQDDWSDFVRGRKSKKREGLAEVDDDARKLLAEIESARSGAKEGRP